MLKRATEIKDLYDNDYLRNYEVEKMLLLVQEINGFSELCIDTSFMKNLDQKIIFDNYQQVFESDYQGDTSAFSMDQRFLFNDLKQQAMKL